MILIYTPLLFAASAALIHFAPLRTKFVIAFALITTAALIASGMALHQLTGSHLSQLLWQTQSPLFGVDAGSINPLSALFLLLISLGSVTAILHSRNYSTKTPAEASIHYTALVTLTLSMLGTVVSEGGFSFLLFWELTTLSTLLFIRKNLKKNHIRSYIFRAHIGFILLVAAFVWLKLSYGAADFPALDGYFHEHAALPLFLLLILGFGTRIGLFLLHDQHADAHPAHVWSLLSGVLVLMGIYGILRTTLALIGVPTLGTAGVILLILGIATAVRGTMLLLRESNTNRLITHSGLRSIGILLIGIGIAAISKHSGNLTGAVCGISGALLQAFNHSFCRPLLLFNTKTPQNRSLFSLIGIAALCALPPLGGFVSELILCVGLYDGIAAESSTLASAAGLVSVTLSGVVSLLIFTRQWTDVQHHSTTQTSKSNGFRLLASAIPLAGLLLLGLFPQTTANLVLRSAGVLLPGSNTQMGTLLLHPTLSALGRTIWLLLFVIGLLFWLRGRIQSKR